MLKRAAALAGAGFLLAALGMAQEADYGITVPVTATFGAMDTHRFNLRDASASPAAANFRLMFYPTVRLGKHWFAYAAVQVRRLPFFYYDAYLTDRGMEGDLIQGYVGYSIRRGAAAVVLKAGQMTSAFGSFPLRYDDMQNPLMDQPLSYITELPLRTDQLSCGTADLLKQHYGSVGAGCGGAAGRGPGLTPVTLYGLPAAQAEFSFKRFDARAQLTASSPAATDGWHISRQYVQGTVGGGYSIRQGFRVGVSAFRGPYLDRSVATWLPAGTTVRSFPAGGQGLDVEWARGRLSVNGELQRLHFDAPNFVVAPGFTTGYAEAKARLTPRLYAAVRQGFLKSGSVLDTRGVSSDEFSATLRATEVGLGCWLLPRLLMKVSYEFSQSAGTPGTHNNVLGIQLVASFRQVQWAWR